MAAVRLAAVLPLTLAVALTAQNTSTSQVAITIADPTGAVIPGAHVGIIQLPSVIPIDGDWRNYEFTAPEQASIQTDGSGAVAVGLAKGSYAITIVANGFKRYFERIEVGNEPTQSYRATLVIDSFRGVIATMEVIPLEPSSLDVFIPIEPLQPVTFSRRFRRRW